MLAIPSKGKLKEEDARNEEFNKEVEEVEKGTGIRAVNKGKQMDNKGSNY